jgi:hypothetical protein
MEFANRKRFSERDRVSRFIHALAVGMMVLAVIFVVLDEYGLLPQLPPATVAHDSTANGGPGSRHG